MGSYDWVDRSDAEFSMSYSSSVDAEEEEREGVSLVTDENNDVVDDS